MQGYEGELIALAAAIFAGAFGGVLAGLLGVGGGIVIVPVLYTAMGFTGMGSETTMQVAVATSFATIIFTSLSSASGHYRKGSLDMALLRRWVPSIIAGVIIGSLLGGVVSGKIMVAVFAIVAALVSADIILRKPKPVGDKEYSATIWAGSGIFAGAVSGMMGIGGGTVCVPILNMLGYDIRKAVGTSAAIGFLISVPATLVYIVTGWNVSGLPAFSLGYVNLVGAIVIIPLSTVFARVGVKIAHTIPERALKICFGIFLGITSLRMFIDLLG